jgi:hypothetical protein
MTTTTTTMTMMKNDQAQKSGNGFKNRDNGRNPVQKSTTRQSMAILEIKHAHQSEHTIKASFKDNKGSDIEEFIYMFCDSDPAELLIELEKQLIKLGNRYDLFENGRCK